MNEKELRERQLDAFEERELRGEKAREKKEAMFVKVVGLALDMLSERVFTFTAMGIAAGLYLWAMVEPSMLRIITAATFTGTVFFPVWFRKKGM